MSPLTLRQAACQERSGDTRRMNWSWMGPWQPTHRGADSSRPGNEWWEMKLFWHSHSVRTRVYKRNFPPETCYHHLLKIYSIKASLLVLCNLGQWSYQESRCLSVTTSDPDLHHDGQAWSSGSSGGCRHWVIARDGFVSSWRMQCPGHTSALESHYAALLISALLSCFTHFLIFSESSQRIIDRV